jgi:hypothetical protein
MLSRRLLIGLLLAAATSVGCVRSVSVPRELPVEQPLALDALVTRVNDRTQIERVQANISLRFRDLGEAVEGRNKEYPAADGILLLARPESIRLRISAPFVGKKIADMVSDGTTFTLALYYPEDKRRFVRGSNAGRYKRMESGTETDDPTLRQAGALANIRPQHLTEAFLLRPLALDDPNGLYYLEETRQIEREARSGSKKSMEVVRRYYVLTLLERVQGSEARILRRLWFDRTRSGTPLSRQELYEGGTLATSIRYEGHKPVEGLSATWPDRVTILREEDGYSVEVVFERKALRINSQVPPEAFLLENVEELPEVDLDKRPDLVEPGRR